MPVPTRMTAALRKPGCQAMPKRGAKLCLIGVAWDARKTGARQIVLEKMLRHRVELVRENQHCWGTVPDIYRQME
jgi:hypothetical protein